MITRSKIVNLLLILSLSMVFATCFGRPIVNVYLSGGVVPEQLILDFEKETGIKVNLSTYDSNETMYAKLRANKKNIYDLILPSSYYVERMKKNGLLSPLDHKKLPNLKNLDPTFKNNPFDPHNHYHIPLIWGVTGIFYNDHWIHKPPTSWQDLWEPRWKNQLMILDDIRDIFATALIKLGYTPNDTDPQHIKAAYQQLLKLIPNIKLFTVDAIDALMIDEDANIGVVWNGNVTKAQSENPHIRFVYPKEGFVIWIECLAIPKSAPHPKEAYQFIDYLLRAESGAQILKAYHFAITNQASQKLLPKSILLNPNIYPSTDVMKHGYYLRNIDEKTLELYNQYWESLKLAC